MDGIENTKTALTDQELWEYELAGFNRLASEPWHLRRLALRHKVRRLARMFWSM